MKKIVILKNNEGRLGNQLWMYANIYSFCLENNLECSNYAFYRYQHYFNFKHFELFDFIFKKTSNKFVMKFFVILYRAFTFFLVKIVKKEKVAFEKKAESLNSFLETNKEKVDLLLNKKNDCLYVCGWPLSNPEGIYKYHDQIINTFRPKEEHLKNSTELVSNLRTRYDKIVGVHYRQGDYKKFCNGSFFVKKETILDTLKKYSKMNPSKKIVFLIFSDEKVNIKKDSLNLVFGSGKEIEDLYSLSMCDLIIGSNSTFSMWAAMYGKIPFIEFGEKFSDAKIPYEIKKW